MNLIPNYADGGWKAYFIPIISIDLITELISIVNYFDWKTLQLHYEFECMIDYNTVSCMGQSKQ